MTEVFYNYVYVDPRKPGKYSYNNINVCFLYEPFYVGKGKNYRYLDHLKDTRNSRKTNKIKKILSEKFNLERYVIILNKNISEQESFDFERILIHSIGRLGEDHGVLTNIHEGGLGGDTISTNPKRKEIIDKLRNIPSKKKAKSYEEIYGDKAQLEKEKRRKSNLGVKHSEERRKNCSKGHIGKIPWNKGIHGDPRIKNQYNKKETK